MLPPHLAQSVCFQSKRDTAEGVHREPEIEIVDVHSNPGSEISCLEKLFRDRTVFQDDFLHVTTELGRCEETTRGFPLSAPFLPVHCKDSFPEQFLEDEDPIQGEDEGIEVVLQNVFDVPWIDRVDRLQQGGHAAETRTTEHGTRAEGGKGEHVGDSQVDRKGVTS